MTDDRKTDDNGESSVEPGTVLAAKAATTLLESSRRIIERLLGPMADEVGAYLAERTRLKLENSLRIARLAHSKLGEERSGPPLTMRTALKVFDVAGDIGPDEDEVVTEYVAGILASAVREKEGGASENAIAHISLLDRMPAAHIRLHYILYRAMQYAYQGTACDIYSSEDMDALYTYVPFDHLESVINADSDGLYWLKKDDLVSYFAYGDRNLLRRFYEPVPGPGLIYSPTPLGIELFAWGMASAGSVRRVLMEDPAKFRLADVDEDMAGVARTRQHHVTHPADADFSDELTSADSTSQEDVVE